MTESWLFTSDDFPTAACRHTARVKHRHPYLDAPLPLPFAHRGGAAHGDENTAGAFERAVKAGFRYVETDVHATADGVPVVIHDADLVRVAGQTARVRTLTWTDLATIRVGGAAAVPRLDDVLQAWPEVRFNIDVKADSAVEPEMRTVRDTRSEDRVLLASFSDARLTRIRSLGGARIATSLGMRAVARLRVASMAGIPLRLPPSAIAAQVPVRPGRLTVVTRRFVSYAHRLGLQVHVWTIDDPVEMNRLLDLGVDGIMTDRIEVLREVLTERGSWH